LVGGALLEAFQEGGVLEGFEETDEGIFDGAFVAVEKEEAVVGIVAAAHCDQVGREDVIVAGEVAAFELEEEILGGREFAEFPGEVDDLREEDVLEGRPGREDASEFLPEVLKEGGHDFGQNGVFIRLAGAQAMFEGVEAGALLSGEGSGSGGFQGVAAGLLLAGGRARAGGFEGISAVCGEPGGGDVGHVDAPFYYMFAYCTVC
jgi:hypothetical protein